MLLSAAGERERDSMSWTRMLAVLLGFSAAGVLAQFNDQNGVLTIAVPQGGSFKFTRGHKVCRALDAGTNRSDSIIASASWTADSCSGFANSVGLRHRSAYRPSRRDRSSALAGPTATARPHAQRR